MSLKFQYRQISVHFQAIQRDIRTHYLLKATFSSFDILLKISSFKVIVFSIHSINPNLENKIQRFK